MKSCGAGRNSNGIAPSSTHTEGLTRGDWPPMAEHDQELLLLVFALMNAGRELRPLRAVDRQISEPLLVIVPPGLDVPLWQCCSEGPEPHPQVAHTLVVALIPLQVPEAPVVVVEPLVAPDAHGQLGVEIKVLLAYLVVR